MNKQKAAELSAEHVSPETQRRDLLVIVLGSLLLFSLNVNFLLYGDAALYGDYSLRRSFTEVTLHLGYYYILVGAQAILGTLFHLPMQETMVWVNVVFGALLLAVSYLIALELLGNRRDALLTVLILGFSGRVMNNATTSEMYVVQTSFVLLSFLMFMREKPILAGIFAACSLLVSPLSAFAFLFYPVYDYQKTGRIRWALLVTLTVAAILAYLPYFAFYYHDLLWGKRGLLGINGTMHPRFMLMLRNFPKYQFKQYTALLLLVIPALYYARRHARLMVLATAVAIPHLYIILKLTGEDNVFILNTDLFFVMMLVTVWREWSARPFLKWIPPVLLATHVAILIMSRSIFAFSPNRGYADDMKNVADQYLNGKDATVIADWGTGVSLVFFGRPAPTAALMQEPLFKQVYDLDDPEEVHPEVLNVKDLYLLDRWNPTPLNRFLSSSESIREQYRQNSTRVLAEQQLNIKCTLVREATNKLYHCSRNAPSL